MCTTTWGSNAVIVSTMRSCSTGAMRWNAARWRRRRGGSTSIPTSSPTHGSCSSATATRDPRSPPIPLTSTRRPAAMLATLLAGHLLTAASPATWAGAGPDLTQLRREEDHVAGERVELAPGEALGDGDRLGVVVDEAGPADVAAHDPDDAVTDL